MLILPIVNRNRILNVEVRLKNAEKIRSGVILEETGESEVIVNGKKFSTSSYSDKDQDEASVVDFIRNTSVLHKNDYLITTRENSDSKFYDVYTVGQPLKKVNKGLDNLYASVVTDMRKEIPGVRRGRYLSFKKLGMDHNLTDDKIAKLQRIVHEERDQSKWPRLFEKEGIADLPKTIEFVNMFDCTVVSDTTIPEDIMDSTIKSLEPLNTQEYRGLKKYYDMAKSNKDIYTRLSLINKLVYNRPFELITTPSKKAKQLIKVKDNSDGVNAT